VRRQNAERCHQNLLRLFVPDRPTTPALTDRPLAHAALQANDVPRWETYGTSADFARHRGEGLASAGH
jgi:hypothetical protein